jgi:alkanesulfonate monooxygenase SsuD/methylene tetrahydromethanopterin reductase-like flavin-dependent oxidoreductase (luciferase family)
MPPVPTAPFAPASISFRCYPHTELGATAILDELGAQATLAISHGFDGVMTSEHHGGFAGYLPNPLQVAGMLLESMPAGWAAACPLLLPLRPAALVAEEAAWLAARFPGRVGLGVAAGSLPTDFELMGLSMEGLTARFADGLELVARLLRGGDRDDVLAHDPAIARCREHPLPVLSAAASVRAVERAARLGVGLLLHSLATPERCRQLADAYREAGGHAPVVVIRRAWLGAAPRAQLDAQLDVYRSYTPKKAQAHWGADELASRADPDEVADDIVAAVRASGADAVNLRVHVPGVTPETAREQIVRIGDEVIPRVRAALEGARSAG